MPQIEKLKQFIDKNIDNCDANYSATGKVLLVKMRDFQNLVVSIILNSERNTIVCRTMLFKETLALESEDFNLYRALLSANSIMPLSHYAISDGFVNLIGELDFDSYESSIEKELNTIALNHFETLLSLETLKQSK